MTVAMARKMGVTTLFHAHEMISTTALKTVDTTSQMSLNAGITTPVITVPMNRKMGWMILFHAHEMTLTAALKTEDTISQINLNAGTTTPPMTDLTHPKMMPRPSTNSFVTTSMRPHAHFTTSTSHLKTGASTLLMKRPMPWMIGLIIAQATLMVVEMTAQAALKIVVMTVQIALKKSTTIFQ